MLTGHFYHGHIRRIVSVFGSLFNNINVVRKDQTSKVIYSTRVPLAYGPKSKFLMRLDAQAALVDDDKIAMKLPRMSFEITSMTYDATTKINRNNTLSAIDANDSSIKHNLRTFAPYRINFQLSIMAKNQDDALQITEQILPYFQPDYTVTITEVDSVNITTDIPFVLSGVTMTDDYEGDAMTRRAIVYTLDFETRVRFYGPVTKRALIRVSDINLNTNKMTDTPGVLIHTTVSSIEDTPTNFTVVQTETDFGFDELNT